jgi:arsenate reductase
MANAYFNALSDVSKARSFSAGTQPGDHVHPVVQEV